METLIQDLRYGIRLLLKDRGLTAAAVFSLALAIGANSAIFSIVNTILIRPLPYKDQDRLVWMWGNNMKLGANQASVSPPDFLDYRSQNRVFEEIAAFLPTPLNYTGMGEPERFNGAVVSSGFFEVLGIPPVWGRTFLREEEQAGREQVAVLSHALWQRRFGADRNLIGQAIILDGKSFTVVGVMPSDFQFPSQTELWIPMPFHLRGMQVRRAHFIRPIARLKPGVSLPGAQAEMDVIAQRLAQQYPESNNGYGARLVPLRDAVVGNIQSALWILFGAVGFVLLIACANVANLLLSRAVVRQKEIAVRLALGASRTRLIRQLLTESIVLALLGAGLGLLLASGEISVLIRSLPTNIPRMAEIRIDGIVVAFTVVVALLTGLLFGLAPALQTSRPDLYDPLREGGVRSTSRPGASKIRNLFVILEVAIALVLLLGAGLMIKSFLRLQAVDPGFGTDNVLTMQISLPASKYRELKQTASFYQQALKRIEELPGVQSVAIISEIPLGGQQNDTSFTIEGRSPAATGEKTFANYRVISPDLFRALHIPLLKGRIFTAHDNTDAPRVCIISEALARRYFPNEDPLGRRLLIDFGEVFSAEIVGVVGNVRQAALTVEPWQEIYVPYTAKPRNTMALVVRTGSDPSSLAPSVRREIQAIDRDQPVFNISTMAQILSKSIAQQRFNVLLLSIFGGVALVLAVVGIYSIISYSVSQRTHEIGIRMAMGAEPGHVLRLVIRQGLSLALWGVIIGLAGALMISQVISSLLYGIGSKDPAIFASMPLVLIVVALIAVYIPARQATRVDPMVVLRHE